MDGDLDFGASNSTSKRNAKQGRRAAQEPQKHESSSEEGEVNEEDVDVVSEDDMHKSDHEEAPPKPSKGGWGEESSGATSARPTQRRRRGEDDDIKDIDSFEDSRLKTGDSDSDQGPDIPVIPELEDNPDEEMSQQVSVVPRVQVNRVATYRDLEHDLGQYAALTTLDNEIDLKILTKCLVPEADITEENVGWTWDTLFTEVSSELLTEWEAAEQAEQDALAQAS